MSKRRMFSQSVVEHDAVLDMPATTQNLYFHLSMNADDDGFLSPKRIMRMVGASENDLKILLLKRYILGFESGVVVIKQWKINNIIRNDRYVKTTFEHELSTLTNNEYGAYTELLKIPDVVKSIEDEITTDMGTLTDEEENNKEVGIPDVIPPVVVGKVRLGSNRISKDILVDLDEPNPRPKNGSAKDLIRILVEALGFSPKTLATEGRVSKLKRRLKTFTPAELVQAAKAIASDEYLQGANDSGKRYGNIDYLLRSDEIVDKFLNGETAVTEEKLDESRYV